MAFKERIIFLTKNQEIIYNIVLIILVPAAIITNTILFTSQFKQTIDQSLYLKATAISEVLNAAMVGDFNDHEALKKLVVNVAKYNNDIKTLDVMKYDQTASDFKIVASLKQSLIGQSTKATNYFMAWNKNWPVAVISKAPSGVNGQMERVWLIASPLRDEAGQAQAMLSLAVSLQLMDEFTKPVLTRSIVILLITVLIVVLLLFGNARLFEYALLYNKIKEVDQMKDEFISMASHELRTPITVIDGYATIMLEDQSGHIVVNDAAKESLSMIKGSTARLKVLIEDLLNVSRIEQGRMSCNLINTDVNPIIAGVVTELTNSAEQKKLKLSYQPHTKKALMLEIDSDRLKQVLFNLIGNAIKYTPSGTVTVLTERSTKGDNLEIKIKDTGIGMSAKDRERLFEKFYRVSNEKTAEISGTGLGLWITKKIIEMMKGQISIDSIENVGTQVSLTFPLLKK